MPAGAKSANEPRAAICYKNLGNREMKSRFCFILLAGGLAGALLHGQGAPAAGDPLRIAPRHLEVLPGQRVVLMGDSIVRGFAFGNYTNPSPLRTLYGIANLLLKQNLSYPPEVKALPRIWQGLKPDGSPVTVDTMAGELQVNYRRGELRVGDWLVYEDAGELNMVEHPAPWPDGHNMYGRQREALRGLLLEARNIIGCEHVLMMTMFDYDPKIPWCQWDAPLDDGAHTGNDAIRDEAAAHDVRVMDMRRVMNRAEECVAAGGWGRIVGPDGIHPNVFGNYVMALVILKTLGGQIEHWNLDGLSRHFMHPAAGGDVEKVWGFSKDPTDVERVRLLTELRDIVVRELVWRLAKASSSAAGSGAVRKADADRSFPRLLRYGRILAHPAMQPEGTTRPVSYEVGGLLQLDREHCLLLASMREQGGHDFEVGNDGFVFRDLFEIVPEKAIPINRLDAHFKLKSGETPAILGKFPVSGGFVPLGAKLANGSPHPAAGTGFLVSGSLPFLPDRSAGHPLAGADDRPFDLVQLRWDGKSLQITSRQQLKTLAGVRLGRIGLSNFCAQDRGFLCPFGADDGSFVVVVRFDWAGQSWQATTAGKPFVTAQPPKDQQGIARVYRYLEVESSILHVGDHYLVHTRGCDPKGRVYVSDDGLNYKFWFDHHNHTVPQVLNQGLDGSLYLATNPGPGWLRNPLLAYPVRGETLAAPIVIHDEKKIRGDKGDEVPFCDHCRGANVFLEGRWRHLVLYRVCDKSETDGKGAPAFPQTGLYLAELEYDQATCTPFSF